MLAQLKRRPVPARALGNFVKPDTGKPILTAGDQLRRVRHHASACDRTITLTGIC